MKNAIHTEQYKGFTINVVSDSYPLNPRTEWDNLATLALFHSRYSLGDKNHGLTMAECAAIRKNKKDYLSLPVFGYDHGGITINTVGYSCHWDSGQLGIIFISKADIRKEYSVKRISKKLEQKVYDIMRGEVKTYDDYLTGNVYGFIIEDKQGETVDSCFGYYGDYQGYLMQEAKSMCDYTDKEKLPLLAHAGLLH